MSLLALLSPLLRIPLSTTVMAGLAMAGQSSAPIHSSTPIQSSAPTNEAAAVQTEFAHPPDDARILMRWWWFGTAVEKPELERELLVMKAAGIGGVEIQPVYPLELDDAARRIVNHPYLSDEFLDDIRFVSNRTAELGMRMDVTLGSGWPFGGPHTPVTEAASRLRIERVATEPGQTSVAVPAMGNGEALLAIYLARGERRQFSAVNAQRLTAGPDGRVAIPGGDAGPHTAVFFMGSRTGQQVKRAAVGAEGFVLDHYSREAIEHHLQAVAEPLLLSFGDRRPYSVFSDSLEVFSTDWTPKFLEEFKKRAGYDLDQHWMALVADDDPDARAVRHDWGQVLTALAEENYLAPIREWAHQHGTKFRSQTYGEPPAVLSSNEMVDLPEGEAGPRWREFSTARWAASASHIYRRPVTSTETWTWLHSPASRATPLDMKVEADLHFLQGITQLVGHGWPYSPAHAGEPGWRFYAAAALNEHNPWFQVMPEIASYLQRLSFLLRQGEPANDVAVYLPTDDAWANFKPGKASVDRQMATMLGPVLIPQILNAGYNFDFVDDRGLEHLLAGGPLPWKAIVVPGVERMPLRTVEMLGRFQASGGLVLATKRRPSLAPGFLDGPAGSAGVAAGTGTLKLIANEEELGANLQRAVAPDFAVSTRAASAMGFVHRRLRDADVYFLANTSNQAVKDNAVVRTSRAVAEWWDPVTGLTRAASATLAANGRTSVALDLAPYESRILVVRDGVVRDGTRPTRPADHSTVVSKASLDKDWKVTFSRSGQVKTSQTLRSWSEDEDTRFYSGEVVYEHAFDGKAGAKTTVDFGPGKAVESSQGPGSPGMQALLEAPVRESAVVFVNGQRAGAVWQAPFALDVSRWVRNGENQLRIVVANTAINEIAGKALPNYKLLNARYGERFVPQGFENIAPLPSGILGPVRIREER